MPAPPVPFGVPAQFRGQTLTSYQPTFREAATDMLRRALFSDDRAGQRKAERVSNVLETVTPFGFATGIDDMKEAVGQGDYATASMMGAMAMVPGPSPKFVRNLKGQKVAPPREFYRGTNPGDERRIKTGATDWDSYLFAADNEPAAKMYGQSIEKIQAKPDANVLYEGSAAWRKVVGNIRKDETMLQYADRAAKAAREAGYDAAWFQRQGDIGTAIFNQDKFVRGNSPKIKAYHGSPHSFDRFSMDKIGTGEGAQAYGHGLYFAENEGVAKGYRDNLSPSTIDGVPAKQVGTTASQSDDDLLQSVLAMEKTPENARWRLDRLNRLDLVEKLDEMVAAGRIKPSGSMYEVNINASPDDFLDWDKPLSEQPEKVRQALGLDALPGPPSDEEVQAVIALGQQRGINPMDMPEWKALEARLDNYKADAWKQMGITPPYRGDTHLRADEITGGEYLHALEKGELGPRALGGTTPTASMRLKEKGIPGIKYLDAGSRGTSGGEILDVAKGPDGFRAKIKKFGGGAIGAAPTDMVTTSRPFPTEEAARKWASEQIASGTRNYVVFDDKLIEIVRKYGIAGASAMLGYNILDGMDEAQAKELKKIDGSGW